MDEDTRQYIAEMHELFGTKGWKNLVSEASEAIEQRKDQLVRAGSIDEVRFLQGEIAQLSTLASLEAVVALREKSIKEQEDLETID